MAVLAALCLLTPLAGSRLWPVLAGAVSLVGGVAAAASTAPAIGAVLAGVTWGGLAVWLLIALVVLLRRRRLAGIPS